MNARTDATQLEMARHLAASGQHEAALALLEQGDAATGLRYMLQGKILAQLRRFPAAIDAWRRVLEKEPDHQAAQQAIARAQKAMRPWIGRLYYYSVARLGSAVLLVAVLGLSGWAIASAGQSPGSSSVPGPGVAGDPARDDEQRELRRHLQRLDAAVANLQHASVPSVAHPPESESLAELKRLQQQVQTLNEALGVLQQQSDTLTSSLDTLADRAKEMETHMERQSGEVESLARQLPVLTDQLSTASRNQSAWRRDELSWRIDTLMHRELSVSGTNAARQSEAILLDIVSLTDQLRALPLDASWRSYLASIEQWVQTRRRQLQSD